MLFAAAALVTAITIDYPAEGAVFPPEFPPPVFLYRDPAATSWRVEVAGTQVNIKGEPARAGEIDPRCVAPTNELPKPPDAHTWVPDAAAWAAVKSRAAATVTIVGLRGGDVVSRGSVTIHVSKDPVGAPIFYRDVPLMPSETEKGVIKPLAPSAVPLIAWRLRDVGEPRSRLLMEGLHTCANCHSFSRDGKTMGMDVDGPQNDKGLYALVDVKPRTSIRSQDVIAWSSFRGKLGGRLRVGFMPQVSPDGQYVVTTINDPGREQPPAQRRRNPIDLIDNYYVANFKDYRFLQVFYPTRGILAWYSRATGRLEPLPGADDPKYVHANATWSPDGKYLVFARAEARNAYPPGRPPAGYANDPNEPPVQYDLYRIPFNAGRGGRAEPVAGASANGMSNTFPKISPDGRWIVWVQCRNGQLMRPDSRLFIVPFDGGRARRMRCNTPLMNSWHSFSPNGRWMVFSSKSRSPYTQMFLTHIDENGEDSPPVLIENATAANRAVNLPEFVNVPPGGLLSMDAPATEFYRLFDAAAELAEKGRYEDAIPAWRAALALNRDDVRAGNNLGAALLETGRAEEARRCFERALARDAADPEVLNNLGVALMRLGKTEDAVRRFEQALAADPESAKAHRNLGSVLAAQGRLEQAIGHFRKALPDPDAANDLGIALARAGRLDDAIPHLEAAVAARPGSFQFRFNLGRLLEAKGRYREAVAQFEKAVELSGGREPRIVHALEQARRRIIGRR